MPITRLAAIMFTDIVGYTAMMQSDREQAMATVKQFETVLKDRIATHHGELLQTYGDGSLSIFDSASGAVQCAKEIQEAIHGDVPLRIGIHLGEITIDGEHTFGDGVNKASRIESMGVAGAVLLSSSIRQQIKNKPEFELVSMGKFAFKNVAEPMTVYALGNEGLVVPKAGHMKGKGERVKLPVKSLVRMASLGFAAMFVGAVLLWQFGGIWLDDEELLSKDIREAKVAVAVLENFTGDKELDALGNMASEWITAGFRELQVRTVSPEMVRLHNDKIGILPEDENGKDSFADLTGADYVISGSYFFEDDSIELSVRLNSTYSGETIISFPNIKEHFDQKQNLITKASDHLLGYWFTKQKASNVNYIQQANPPTYEAFKVYFNNVYHWDTADSALKIDPNFIIARWRVLYNAVINNNDSMYQVHKSWIDAHWEKCTAYEKDAFREAFALWEGEYETAFQAFERMYTLHPRDYMAIHESGFLALYMLNQPRFAKERYEQIHNYPERYGDLYAASYTFRNYFDALNRLKLYKETSDFYLGLNEQLKKKAGDIGAYEVYAALIYQNRIEEVKNFIQKRGNNRFDHLRAAYCYSYIYPEAETNPFAEGLEDQLPKFTVPSANNVGIDLLNWNSPTMVLYVLEEWEKLEKMLLDMRTMDWKSYNETPYHENQHEFWIESLLGCVYAQQGKNDLALAQIDIVKELGEQYHNDHHSHFLRGETPYLLARIYACLGEQQTATDYVQTAIEQGRTSERWNVNFDLFLVNLKGYEPFEALIRPNE